MNDDTPALPPVGGALVLPVPVFAAVRGSRIHTGLLVSHTGRVAICASGEGMGVELEPSELVGLGRLLVAVGEARERAADAAAADASFALDRIFAGAGGNA
ncbi:hypothetical protein ACQW02_25630 [Humitalea sp. 24SJ18S-53]|uniref:hypothetical protein n=1 Tax=Humitalea sp. 24SJ18S-53 TaxID=3422307 RepID=UPI003D673CB4